MMDGRVAILLFLSIYFGFLIRVNLMLFQCSILFFGCILPPTSLQYLFLLILPANYHWIQDMIKRASLSLMHLVSLMNLFVFKCDLLHLSSNVLSCIVLSHKHKGGYSVGYWRNLYLHEDLKSFMNLLWCGKKFVLWSLMTLVVIFHQRSYTFWT